jgi:hypothetical protein
MFGDFFSVCDGYFNDWSRLAEVLNWLSMIVFALLLFLGRLELKDPIV